MKHFLRDWWLYLISLGMLARCAWYWVDVRRHARVAKVEREACERLYKLTSDGIDTWIADRQRAFDDRKDLDRRFLAELDARFGTDVAREREKGKPQ